MVATQQIDLENAFDRVRQDVLFCILGHVGIRNMSFRGVKMAYSNCVTKLNINRSLLQVIPVGSSVRQGCPLSALLFSVYLEPYCLSVARSQCVNGFKLQSVEVEVCG